MNVAKTFAPLLLALALSVALIGCKKGIQTVSVDREQVLKIEVAREANLALRAAIFSAERPPVRTGGETVVTPTLPAHDVRTIARSQDLLRAQIQEEYSRARRALTARLLKFYESDLRQFTLNLRTQNDVDRQELDNNFLTEIRQLFEATAAKRAPKVIRLSFIAGYPDDNPDSEPLPADTIYDRKRWEDEAKQLRADIAAIDKEFESASTLLSARYAEQVDSIKDQTAAEIKRYQRELNARAETEAAAQVKSFKGLVILKLSAATSTSYPQLTSITQSSPGVRGLPKPPVIDYSILKVDRGWVEAAVDADLKTWALLKNYSLNKSGKGITDRTEEFIRWRRTRKLGP